MDKHFLQLRSQGCRGAWEVFLRARETYLAGSPAHAGPGAPTPAPALRPGLRVALYFAPGEEDAASAWHGTVRRLGATPLSFAGETASEVGVLSLCEEATHIQADLLVVGGIAPAVLTELARIAPMSVVNAGNETARPCRVLADLLATSLRHGTTDNTLDAVRIGWVGDADGMNAGLARSWLDSVLCFRHELFMAFPQGHEPDAEHLDFAMSAGAKIFLSYDPLPAVDGCHALVAAPWNAPVRGLRPRHPLASDAELDRAASGIPVCSFHADMPPDEADARWAADREACLQACQAAVAELLLAPAGETVNVQQSDAQSVATR